MYRHSRWLKNSCKYLWKNMWNVFSLFRENFNDTYSNLQLTNFYVSIVQKYPKWIILFITEKRTVIKHTNLENKIRFWVRQHSNRCHPNDIGYALEQHVRILKAENKMGVVQDAQTRMHHAMHWNTTVTALFVWIKEHALLLKAFSLVSGRTGFLHRTSYIATTLNKENTPST